jgi:hypothetical protein
MERGRGVHEAVMVADARSRARFGPCEVSLVALITRFFSKSTGPTALHREQIGNARCPWPLSGSVSYFARKRIAGPDFRRSDVEQNVNSA